MTLLSSYNRNYPGIKVTKCIQINPASVGYVIHMFYYDQFMNKTHEEGMQNIC